jgi:copper(I)-binding protein
MALLFITATGLLSTTSAIGIAAETSKRVIRVENGRLDIGDVKAGEEGVATFILHNEGDSEIRVLHAKPS